MRPTMDGARLQRSSVFILHGDKPGEPYISCVGRLEIHQSASTQFGGNQLTDFDCFLDSEIEIEIETEMWRLHLFLVVSTCFYIPHDAKPTKRSTILDKGAPFASSTPSSLTTLVLDVMASSSMAATSSTAATTTMLFSTTTETAPRTQRVTNIGRLAAKDLADLLLASMQARGTKLTPAQEATMKTLRTPDAKDSKANAVLLNLGMDVIIEILIGTRQEATCGHVIRDIEKSQDRNSLTLTLRSFLALCTFNGIECSADEVVQVIKGSQTRQRQQAKAMEEQAEGSGIRTARRVGDVKDDRESVLSFLRERNLAEHSAILNTLLQVCGASSGESHKIIRNLRESK